MKIHRNLHVVAFVAAMMALGAQAVPVSSAQVLDAVSAWAAANGAAFAGPGSVVSAEPVHDDGGANVLYWVVSMANGGAVIAAPDTDLDLVVAVLEKYDGALPAGHPLPSMLKQDLRNRLAVLARRTAASGRPRLKATAGSGEAETAAGDAGLAQAVSAANAQWAKYGVGTRRQILRGTEMTDDSPYVRRIVDGFESDGRFTHWNQSGGIYNACTPNNEVCGCVATAGAAILQFFNCTNDPGAVKSSIGCKLYDQPYACETLAGETDWSALPVRYGGATEGGLDEAGRQLLGRVTYNVGVLVGMSWATKGPGEDSGSYVQDLAKAFKQYGFATSRYVAYSNAANTDGGEFMKTLYAQLWCGAPAVLGIEGTVGGHAVVACGYARDADGDEFCRIFMGWGGSGDSWYKLPTVSSFSQVQGALTMIGYADDAVVPVYGSANIPGISLTVPGYETDEGAVTAPVDGNGYFGIRVPLSLAATGRSVTYAARGISREIAPFDDAVLADESAGRAALDAALPNEIRFDVLNMDLRSTVASARAVALRDGKALLMVSGNSGTKRTEQLMASLYGLDETADLSNRFVMVFTSVKSAALDGVDGDPSIGVFDPAVGGADLRWWIENGRLAYTNFIEGADVATGELVCSLDTMTDAEVTAALADLLDAGYDAYLRGHSDAVVTVTGVNLDAGSNEPFEVGGPVPVYGVFSNAWTNCEAVVFSSPGAYTNEEEGVVYACVGWSTNSVFAEAGAEADYTPGDSVTLDLTPGEALTFTWVWQASHYRVTAAALLPNGIVSGLVTPEETWCAANDRVTLVATGTVGVFGLNAWSLLRTAPAAVDGDYAAFYNGGSAADAEIIRNGTAISFFVYEPVAVRAKYREGVSVSEPETYTVTLSAEPAEATAYAALQGGFAWGENTTYDPLAHLAPAPDSYTDATGGVWVCTGWRIGDTETSGADITQRLNAASPLTATCLWTLRTPEDPSPGPDDPDPPAPPTPGDITITGIAQAADGSWTITVSGAVKACWYWLHATDDLSAVSGAGSAWTAEKAATAEANPQQAAADGEIVIHATSTGAKRFWRARATSTEEGD